jgi:hypothetical protein
MDIAIVFPVPENPRVQSFRAIGALNIENIAMNQKALRTLGRSDARTDGRLDTNGHLCEHKKLIFSRLAQPIKVKFCTGMYTDMARPMKVFIAQNNVVFDKNLFDNYFQSAH